jgi:hypothetical protein
MSITPKEKEIIFLSQSTFNLLRLKPNYMICFCSKTQNINKKMVHSFNNFSHSYGCIKKINMYSQMEDEIENFRKLSFMPTVSLLRAQKDLEGIKSTRSNRNISLDNLISDIKNNLNSIDLLAYRIEMSTIGSNIGTVYNIIRRLNQPKFFISMDYVTYKNIFIENLIYLNSLIKGNTIQDLYSNITIEIILKQLFIKGSLNKHCLPSSIDYKKFINNNGIFLLKESNLKDLFIISEIEGRKMLTKLIKLDKFSPLFIATLKYLTNKL